MDAGCEAVRAGRHGIEISPAEGGRWGPSVVFRPSGDLAQRLEQLTRAAAGVAGGDHWLSGLCGYAHITVRALEPFSADAPPPDRLGRYVHALRRSTCGETARFAFEAPLISPSRLMIRCRPTTTSADGLRRRYGEELGRDGWLEDIVFPAGRDPIWYCSLLHFGSRVLHPERLITWVLDRKDLATGEVAFDTMELCRWDDDGLAMAPTPLAGIATGPSKSD